MTRQPHNLVQDASHLSLKRANAHFHFRKDDVILFASDRCKAWNAIEGSCVNLGSHSAKALPDMVGPLSHSYTSDIAAKTKNICFAVTP